MNQDKSDNHAKFSEISETLAVCHGINLDELPARIGISKDMFYAYRSGRHRISEKAWRKLEAAEAAAGIKPADLGPIAEPGTPAKTGAEGLERTVVHDLRFIANDLIQLSQSMQKKAAQLLAKAEQVERTLQLPNYPPATATERASAQATLDEFTRQATANLAAEKRSQQRAASGGGRG